MSEYAALIDYLQNQIPEQQTEEGRSIMREWIAALSAPAPQGIGREALIDLLSDWFENKVHGFRDTGNETILAHGDFGQEFSHFALADAILALLPTEPPALGEG